MTEIPDSMLVHQVKVTPFLGVTAKGKTYGAEVTVPCFITHKHRVVRSAQGAEVVSEATIRTKLSWASVITPESTVLLHTETASSSRRATVLTTAENTDGNMGAWQHFRFDV